MSMAIDTTNSSPTWVVELTPRGRAAVAVVQVEGPAAVRAVDACFRAASGRPIDRTAIGRIVFGRWQAGCSTAAGEELVVCRRGPEQVEVHCHGGIAAVRAVVDRLTVQGCRPIDWQDWLAASVPDPLRAAAAVALAQAPTERTAAILLDQYEGALRGSIGRAIAAAAGGDWPQATAVVDQALAWEGVGRRLVAPWHVVIAGPPNVGKSSLKNALVGYQRAIVSDRPGTTRDVVTTTTAIDGWPVQLADTAGLRRSGDEVEAAGVALAETAAAEADLVLIVSENLPGKGLREGGLPDFFPEAGRPDRDAGGVADEGPCRRPVLRVLNKIDRLPAAQRAALGSFDVLTSATSGEGIAALVAALGAKLVPAAPPPGAAVPFTEHQVACFRAAQAAAARHDAAALAACFAPLAGRGENGW